MWSRRWYTACKTGVHGVTGAAVLMADSTEAGHRSVNTSYATLALSFTHTTSLLQHALLFASTMHASWKLQLHAHDKCTGQAFEL